MGISAIFSTITVSSRSLYMQTRYLNYLSKHRKDPCEMCRLGASQPKTNDANQITYRGDLLYITKNLFPYAVWDGSPVIDHLLLVPNRHVDSVSLLTESERTEWAAILAEYEGKNYSIYSRAASNGAKSIVHQHAHLIRVGTRPKRFRRLKHAVRVLFSPR